MTTGSRWFGALALVCAAVAACATGDGRPSGGGGDDDDGQGGAGGDGGSSAGAQCPTYAAALCSKVQECLPTLLTAAFGSVATCEQRFELSCEAEASAAGSSFDDARAKACADAYEVATCTDVRTESIAACLPQPGELANDEACRFDAQCSSTYCHATEADGCGKCAPRAPLGAGCGGDPDSCAFGTTCAAKCVTPGGAGVACSASAPCAKNLYCSAAGTCTPFLQEGQSCLAPDAECDVNAALVCDGGQCVDLALATAGQACGLQGGKLVVCSGGGKCVSGVCAAAAADGAACDSDSGPDCLTPSTCADGTCELPDAAKCAAGSTAMCAEACEPSSSSKSGTSLNGSIIWKQSLECGCGTAQVGIAAGAPCEQAWDCASTCCSCCSGARGYSVQACIGGQCLSAAQACPLVLNEADTSEISDPIQCD